MVWKSAADEGVEGFISFLFLFEHLIFARQTSTGGFVLNLHHALVVISLVLVVTDHSALVKNIESIFKREGVVCM